MENNLKKKYLQLLCIACLSYSFIRSGLSIKPNTDYSNSSSFKPVFSMTVEIRDATILRLLADRFFFFKKTTMSSVFFNIILICFPSFCTRKKFISLLHYFWMYKLNFWHSGNKLYICLYKVCILYCIITVFYMKKIL